MDNSQYPYKCLISDRPVVRAQCGGDDVYAFGYSHILAAPPRLIPDESLQAGNSSVRQRIELKRSHQIRSNFLGSTTPRLPRLTENDYRPLEPVHLIDGDPETCWSSRTQTHHDCEPTWIRLDLVAETTVSQVVLRKRRSAIDRSKPGSVAPPAGTVEVGQSMVDHLEIRVSTDGAHWSTVFAGASGDAPDKSDFVYAFAPVQAKMVLVIGSGYQYMENIRACFSIACLEVLDTAGVNVALVSRGTGITVSSTHVSLGQEIESHRWLWPVQHDMGLKWSRIGYHDDAINWHWVEQEKGVLSVDPVADASITELAENGIEVVMCLNFGNRLYQKDPTRYLPQLWEWYYENPEPPKTDEALAAWARYVRFMVDKYKDRVRYFEVWNEWNGAAYWGDIPDTELFIKLSRIAIPIIRELAPKAYVMLGSTCDCPRLTGMTPEERAVLEDPVIFLTKVREGQSQYLSMPNLERRKWLRLSFLYAIRELAPLVDVLGYHPFYALDPGDPMFLDYKADVRALKAYSERMGFRGNQYMASEFNIAANYPECEDRTHLGFAHFTTEMQKAKYSSRIAALHTALDVGSFFCETWSSTYPMDLSLMRRAFPAYPIMPMQPSAAYYVTRNLSTLLEDLHSTGTTAELTGDPGVEHHVMESADRLTVALWLSGRGKDVSDHKTVNLHVPGSYARVTAANPMNGTRQALAVREAGSDTLIEGLLAADFAILVECWK